jgi:aerobic C4-dicarboxylate transport protein
MSAPLPEHAAHPSTKANRLYLAVLVGISLGILLGWQWPAAGESMKPLGDAFIRIIKMLIAPIIFCTVTTGIASAGDLKRVGRVGLKALLYFETMTTVALLLGLAVVHVIKPGVGIHADAASLSADAVTKVTKGREAQGIVEHLLNIVPENFVSAFTGGEILQVLFVSILTGLALAGLGRQGRPVVLALEHAARVLFKVISLVMLLAPFGAFGAMAYTIGHFGLGSLGHLLTLMLGFYVTSLLFVFVGLGLVCALIGVSIMRLVTHLREELLIVLGTSSSEPVLPQLMDKLEHLGCSPTVVRLVIPTGYSFNLDGTSIYLTMAALFVAQALDVPLSLADQLGLLGVLLLTSKGAAAVTGGGFVTLAATLQTVHTIPVAGLSLLLGVDRFMSEARALTNMVGNSVATLVVAHWEGALDRERMAPVALRRRPPAR